jgi:hypothetical protein
MQNVPTERLAFLFLHGASKACFCKRTCKNKNNGIKRIAFCIMTFACPLGISEVKLSGTIAYSDNTFSSPPLSFPECVFRLRDLNTGLLSGGSPDGMFLNKFLYI